MGMEKKPWVRLWKRRGGNQSVEHAMRNILLAIGVACTLMAALIITNSAVGLPCHLRAICDR
jgi:hypothetical protein